MRRWSSMVLETMLGCTIYRKPNKTQFRFLYMYLPISLTDDSTVLSLDEISFFTIGTSARKGKNKSHTLDEADARPIHAKE